jgi:hypothetical protein
MRKEDMKFCELILNYGERQGGGTCLYLPDNITVWDIADILNEKFKTEIEQELSKRETEKTPCLEII